MEQVCNHATFSDNAELEAIYQRAKQTRSSERRSVMFTRAVADMQVQIAAETGHPVDSEELHAIQSGIICAVGSCCVKAAAPLIEDVPLPRFPEETALTLQS